MSRCVFCEIIRGNVKTKFVCEWVDAIAIVPLNPVCEGHVLVIPKTHCDTATCNPEVAGLAFRRAAEFAKSPCNLIANVGEEASQSVFHLHIHIVPRRKDDGLILPWTAQQKEME